MAADAYLIGKPYSKSKDDTTPDQHHNFVGCRLENRPKHKGKAAHDHGHPSAKAVADPTRQQPFNTYAHALRYSIISKMNHLLMVASR